MRITITARVEFPKGWGYDEDSQSKEVSIELEHNDYVPLPWAVICEQLVEHTIRAREMVEEAKESAESEAAND
jgi:hypothetical protein